jgi:hypothetical protein
LIQKTPLAGQITPLVQRQPEDEEEEEEPIQAKLADGMLVQRQEEEPDEEEEEPIRPKRDSGLRSLAGQGLRNQIDSMGGGQPLPTATRAFFEPRFGCDLSRVRVHSDSQASVTAQVLHARALTRGQDIIFREGEYRPEIPHGKRLLAHELTHVIQQGRTHVRNSVQAQEESEDAKPKMSLKETVTSQESTNFPCYCGEEETKAYNDFEEKFGMNPRDPEMTTALIMKAKGEITPWTKAHDTVLNQLLEEQHYRERAKEFFKHVTDLIQNIHTSYQSKLQIVTKYLELKNDDVVNLFMLRVISEGFEALGEGAVPGSTALAESLKVIWDTHNLAKTASGQNEVSLEVIDAYKDLDIRFHAAFSIIDEWRAEVLTDWVKLQVVGSTPLPKDMGEMEEIWKKLDREYEVALWKQLLSLKWKHMTPADPPEFHTAIDWIDSYETKYPQYYFSYQPGERSSSLGLSETKGFWVTKHWLGSGVTLYTHAKAPRVIAEHLFVELGIPRKEVFEEWNLAKEPYIPESYMLHD